MNLVLKHKNEIIILLVIIGFYFLLRLPNLISQPIFADEAIYIRWAQVMRAEPTLRFLPQSDGKTPLFMWLMIPLLKLFTDPLFAGRFLSVISGFFTMLGVFFLARKVISTKAALWSALLYVVTPYTVFFDRMALVDSMLAAFTVWIIYFSTQLSQKARLDLAMILGYLLGGAILTKTPAMINFLILPVSILGFEKIKHNRKRLIKLAAFWIVAIGIGFVMYNLLRLGPQFHLLSSRNQDYLFSPFELLDRPLDPFIPHLRDLSDWFPKLFSWPILVLVGTGIFYVIKKFNRLGLMILLWVVLPLLLSMAFLKTFTARYLLTSVAPFLIFAGWGIERIIKVSKIPLILFPLLILPALIFDYQLLTSPPPDWLPKEERKGYFEDWTAGYGFSDIAKFLEEKSQSQKVAVGTEGFFGTLPDGLQIYLDKSKVIIIPGHGTISAQVRNAAQENLTFFVGNKSRLSGAVSNVKLIKEYPKAAPLDGREQDAIVLYQILP